MYSNMISSLLEHGQVKTTERKGKDLRRLAERTITRATSLGDILLKRPENLDTEDRARLIHAMRVVRRSLNDRDAVLELFRFIAPRLSLAPTLASASRRHAPWQKRARAFCSPVAIRAKLKKQPAASAPPMAARWMWSSSTSGRSARCAPAVRG